MEDLPFAKELGFLAWGIMAACFLAAVILFFGRQR
jgi:hypothetical protein